MKDWQAFVIEHGARANLGAIAHVVGQPLEAVSRLRRRGVCVRRRQGKHFAELFTLWHGRAPGDADWPKPRKCGGRSYSYEWLEPELALLATLVGTMGKAEIAEVLGKRLQAITGDLTATRTLDSLQVQINRLGLRADDVVGGITAAAAGREIRSYGSVLHAIDRGDLPIRRVGRFMVIPHGVWERWKAARPQPPADYVRLTPIFRRLGISSDSKPAEFAMHVPTAQQFYPFGERGGTSRPGVWFIKGTVAQQLVADRRAGRPMPWHGKPNPSNLKMSWRKLQERQHPRTCTECWRIWGGVAPASFDDFAARYPSLSIGDKRHLTRRWSPGLSVNELSAETGAHPNSIVAAIRRGALRGRKLGHAWFVTRTDATRWKTRRFPSGDGQRSWISAARAKDFYGFGQSELEAFVLSGRLKKHLSAMGRPLYSRVQIGELRQELGYTEREAAARCGISVAKFRIMLRGLDVERRCATGIRPDVIRNVQRRLAVPPGITIAAAAAKVRMPAHWIRYQLQLGRIEVVRAKWDHKTLYVTKATIARLRRIAAAGERRGTTLGPDWLLLSEAARHAGVSTGTVRAWVFEKSIKRRRDAIGDRYSKISIEQRARHYWRQVRFKRAAPPAWLQMEAA